MGGGAWRAALPDWTLPSWLLPTFMRGCGNCGQLRAGSHTISTLDRMAIRCAAAATRENTNMWQYHGNSLPCMLAVFLLYNSSAWMFLYSLHSRVVWTWGLGTLMLAALVSVSLPAASVAFGAPHLPACPQTWVL